LRSFLSYTVHILGNAKVTYLENSFLSYKDVLRLYVPVYNLLIMHYKKAQTNLTNIAKDIFSIKRTLAKDLLWISWSRLPPSAYSMTI